MRHIDKYVRAEIRGMSARYTVAFMAMMGFIISFGMKCNMSAAKAEREKIFDAIKHHELQEMKHNRVIINYKCVAQKKFPTTGFYL